jgi:hypothetical protein
LRQKSRDLEVEKRCGDDKELTCLVEFLLGVQGTQVGDELIGNLRERHVGDVELVFGDEAEQQVEWTAEVR